MDDIHTGDLKCSWFYLKNIILFLSMNFNIIYGCAEYVRIQYNQRRMSTLKHCGASLS